MLNVPFERIKAHSERCCGFSARERDAGNRREAGEGLPRRRGARRTGSPPPFPRVRFGCRRRCLEREVSGPERGVEPEKLLVVQAHRWYCLSRDAFLQEARPLPPVATSCKRLGPLAPRTLSCAPRSLANAVHPVE